MPDAPTQSLEQPTSTPAPASSQANFTGGRRAAMVQALVGAGAPASAGSQVDPMAGGSAAPQIDPPAEPSRPAAAPEARPDDAAAAAIRKQEIHLRRQLADERSQWMSERDQEQATLKPKLEQLAQWEQRMASAKDDPIAYLQAAGFTEADFDHLGRFVYAHSPEGSKDPKNKAQVHQTKAQREYEAKLAKLEERQTTWERQQADHAERLQQQQLIDGFFSTTVKAITDDTPIVRGRIAAMPDVAKARMLEIAERLYVESGPSENLRDVPDGAQIIKAYESERRAELEGDLRALGLDPAVVLRPQAAPGEAAGAQAATPTAGGQPAPRSLTLVPGAGAPTQTARTGRLSRDELVKEVKRIHAVAKP